MKQEDALKLATRCTEELVESLNGEGTEKLRLYLNAMAQFRQYSFRNIMMILAQYSDAEHVAGFNTWKQLGRWVKPGETGIAILAPMVGKPGSVNRDQEMDDERKRLFGFRVVHVFDYKQTEGRELFELSPVLGDPGEAVQILKRVYRSLGIRLEYGPLPGGARGMSTGGRVIIRDGLTPEMECRVLAHELSHELLHTPDRRDRTLTRTMAETEAEAVAYVVCQACQVDSRELSSEYIRLHNGDAKLLQESLERVRSTACHILHLMDEISQPADELVFAAC